MTLALVLLIEFRFLSAWRLSWPLEHLFRHYDLRDVYCVLWDETHYSEKELGLLGKIMRGGYVSRSNKLREIYMPADFLRGSCATIQIWWHH